MREHAPALLAGLGFGALALLILAAAGQPLITDDAWLHLALGRAYAEAGPWLAADPLLANAPSAPTPTAWLFDLGAHGLLTWAGFTGLRIAHVALVATILVLVWTQTRRLSRSALIASAGTALFVALAAYRLVQLRPHLLSMLAVLVLYRVALDRDVRPSGWRIGAVIVICGVWANVHAAFLLGPMLLGAGALGAAAGYALQPSSNRVAARARAIFVATCAALGSIATLFNPAGLEPHLSWFVAGRDTPTLGRVADEWARMDPFAWPLAGLPPSPLAWLVYWALGIATVAVLGVAWRSHRARGATQAEGTSVDPVLALLALVGLAMPLIAVRFLWLGVFAIFLVGQGARSAFPLLRPLAPRVGWAIAMLCFLAAPAFMRFGDWPMVANALPMSWSAYQVPYQAGKYHADLIWILEDAELRGTAFTDYHLAGFAGFQLAPRIRTLINGTLNVSPDVIAANRPLRARSGEREGESFTDLLDRHDVDLYVGIRLPRVPVSARPWFYTTGHLERTPGWIPIFRNLTGAIYLRDNERNRENFERIAAYYADLGLPFDPAIGFDPEQIARVNRGWATQHGVIPLNFASLSQAAFGADPTRRDGARDWLASVYTALGLYERAIELDAARIAADPEAAGARRRLVWCLLRLHRVDEAMAVVGGLEARPASDRLSHRIADTAREVAGLEDDEQIAEAIAQLPVFSGAEANALTRSIVRPGPRLPGS